MLSILLVASIALAVVLGYKTQINTGFFCMAFAYLLGCFGLGMTTKEFSGNASIRFIFRGSSPFYNGSGVFYGTGISGSYYHADLRGSEDG